MQAIASVLDLRRSCLYQGCAWQLASDTSFDIEIRREFDLSAYQTFCEAESRRLIPDAVYYAQMAYNDAFQTLRATQNRFFQALICNQMAVNARKPSDARRHISCGLDLLQEDLCARQELLLERRCKQDEARVLLASHLGLLAILKANQTELENLERSSNLQEQRRLVEKLFHHGRYEQVLEISKNCMREAAELFCGSHWWCGVFALSQAYAHSKQGALAEAICFMNKTEMLLADWGDIDEPEKDFLARERRLLKHLGAALGRLSC